MTTPATFALSLRRAIAERRTNASKVARATGVSASTISRALRGEAIVSDGLFKLMAWVEQTDATPDLIPLKYRDAQGEERTVHLAPEAMLELAKAFLREQGVAVNASHAAYIKEQFPEAM